LTNGAGVWVAGFGWRLVAASTNMVIAFVGRPEWIAVYACTSKVSALATQMAWVLPDSGLIGLSQLHGEAQSPQRLRRVVQMILRLHLVLAGATACAVLTANPAFVKAWVGAEFYGGHALNIWLAAGIIAASLAHGLITTASVLGNRLQVGAATLAHGIVQIALAFILGTWWALGGIAAAALVAALSTSAPAGLALLNVSTGLSFGSFLRDLLWPALQRIGPPLLVSAAAGVLVGDAGMAVAAGATAACVCGYFWAARPLLSELPLGERWRRTLVRARLIPPPAAVAVEPL
jgi:hypothetical protein